MSSILKALKKVEKEKGSYNGAGSPVAREILNDPLRSERRSGSRWRWALVVLLLLGGGAVGGVLLMQQGESPRVQSAPALVVEQPAPEVPVAGQKAPVEPAAPVVAKAEPAPKPAPVGMEIKTVETPPVAPAVVPDPVKIAEEVVMNTRDAAAALKDTAASLKVTADKLKNKVIISSKDAAELTAQRPKPAALAVVAPPIPVAVARPLVAPVSAPATGSTAAPVSSASRNPGWYMSRSADQPVPELRVTEIHWKPAAKDRLAVVNDLPVLEGVDIEGARVDRIFKDRIRFIVNGRYLEVKVNSAPAQ